MYLCMAGGNLRHLTLRGRGVKVNRVWSLEIRSSVVYGGSRDAHAAADPTKTTQVSAPCFTIPGSDHLLLPGPTPMVVAASPSPSNFQQSMDPMVTETILWSTGKSLGYWPMCSAERLAHKTGDGDLIIFLISWLRTQNRRTSDCVNHVFAVCIHVWMDVNIYTHVCSCQRVGTGQSSQD